MNLDGTAKSTAAIDRVRAAELRRFAPWIVVLCAVLWLFVRYLSVKYLGWGTGFDVGLYASYAQSWGSGVAPYVGFHPEYPPGALIAFVIPHLFDGSGDYAHAFALEMAALDLVACLLVVKMTQALFPGRLAEVATSAGLYLLMSTALYPVLYTRFDLVPAVVTLAAVYTLVRGKTGWSAFWIGAAGAIKLWPFALGPLWVLIALRKRGAWGALRTAVFIGLGAIVISAPVLPRAGMAVFEFLKYHEQRGIQIETTWSTVALILNALHLTAVHPEHNFGAFHVAGPLASKFAVWSMPALVIGALLPVTVVAARNWRRIESPDVWIPVVVATVLGFMVAGKVLSPQYVLWLLPLVPLVARRPVPFAMALAIAVLTTVVYPYLSPALEQREPHHVRALLCAGTRNVLLVVFYVMLVVKAARRPRVAG
jgi:uncharacterized membrane protein